MQTVNRSLIRKTLESLEAIMELTDHAEESVMTEEALSAAELVEAPSQTLVRQLVAEIRYCRAEEAEMSAKYSAQGGKLQAYCDEFELSATGYDMVDTVLSDARQVRQDLYTVLSMWTIRPRQWITGAIDAMKGELPMGANDAYVTGYDKLNEIMKRYEE